MDFIYHFFGINCSLNFIFLNLKNLMIYYSIFKYLIFMNFYHPSFFIFNHLNLPLIHLILHLNNSMNFLFHILKSFFIILSFSFINPLNFMMNYDFYYLIFYQYILIFFFFQDQLVNHLIYFLNYFIFLIIHYFYFFVYLENHLNYFLNHLMSFLLFSLKYFIIFYHFH